MQLGKTARKDVMLNELTVECMTDSLRAMKGRMCGRSGLLMLKSRALD